VVIIDLLATNPFELGLREIFEDPAFTLIFHDFCEDCASLFQTFGVRPSRVFDTQIGHRLIKEAEMSSDAKMYAAGLN
jgi:ribonuclease D